jgi:hypothetical protein
VQLVARLTRLQKLTLSTWHPCPQLSSAGLSGLSSLAQLTQLKLSDFTKVDDSLVPHLTGLAQLRRLELTGTGMLGHGLGQLGVLQHLRDLQFTVHRSQRFCSDSIAAGLAQLTQLTGLAVWQFDTWREVPHLTSLSTLTNLRSLTLYSHNIDDTSAGILALPQLTELRVGGVELSSHSSSRGPVLQRLFLSSGVPGVQQLLPLPQLQDLCVEQSSNESTREAAVAAAALCSQTSLTELQLTRLRSLGLNSCNTAGAAGLSVQGLAAIAALPQLQVLNLSGLRGDGWQLALLQRGCRQLTSLRLDGCRRLQTAAVTPLLCLPQLQRLELMCVRRLQRDCVEQVARLCGVELEVDWEENQDERWHEDEDEDE